MKSIPLALTWEFWRHAWWPLLMVIALVSGMMTMLYGGLRIDRFSASHTAMFLHLHMFCFVFVVVGLAAVVCHSTSSPQYRFTLPVSIRTSVLIPMLNGAIATVIGYLAIALLMNWFFNAQWSLVKPTVLAVSMVSVCQAVGWMIWTSSTLRAAIVAGVGTMLGIVVLLINGVNDSIGSFHREWNTMRPLDVALVILVPIAACAFSLVALTFARRGQVISMTAFGRWLLAKIDISFTPTYRAAAPMSAELWAEWTQRGRVMPVGPILVTTILCCFYLSGRFEWQAAVDGIAIFSWLQVVSGAIIGMFLGHVGERFDFHEHLATRPLSDPQLADVKLLNTLRSVCWTWFVWAIGICLIVVCMAVIGKGPSSLSDFVPDEMHPRVLLIGVVIVPMASWTLTSLAASVSILRPWLIKSVCLLVVAFPVIPMGIFASLPHELARDIFNWGGIGVTIGGTLAIYVTAFRLRLITRTRITLVTGAYVLLVATALLFASFMPPPNERMSQAIGFLLSCCILPFVCIAAAPVAIWWNRHR